MTDEAASGGLHIDGDWKAEAAREKELLAEKEAKERAPSPGEGASASGGFVELVNLLTMHAAIALGGATGPTGETVPPNPASAKYHIDLLDVLREKTEGNLTDEENRTLSTVLHELRQHFVQAASAPVVPPPAEKPS